MKRLLIIAGGILIFLSIVPINHYVFDYDGVFDFSRGYIWDNILLLLLGSFLLFWGIKTKKKPGSGNY